MWNKLIVFSFLVAFSVADDDWLTACGNATSDLQAMLVNETEARHDAIGDVYNATNYDKFCKTDHKTSSCVLDMDSIPQEDTFKEACLAVGGKLFEIDETGRYYCKEKGDSDFVRLLNLKTHTECVADVCENDELKDHYKELTQDDADFFSDSLEAECKWEKKYTEYSAANPHTIMSSALVVMATTAALSMTFLIM